MSKGKRQHPLAIFIKALEYSKNFIAPLIFIVGIDVFSGNFSGFSMYYIIAPVVTILLLLGVGAIQWFFFTYSYYDEVLIIKKGMILKKERTIKKNRIQTINLEAGLLLRIFKLTKVNVETAGGLAESELSIEAITKDDAYTLKALLEDESSVPDEEIEQGYTVDAQRLFLAGLTSGSVGIVMAVTFAFASQFIALLPDDFYIQLASLGVIALIGAFLMFTIFSWVVSIVKYVLSYAFYTITKDQEEFNIKRGLIKQKHLSLKAHRIQAITMIEGLLRQPFNYMTIEVDVAGGVQYKDGSKTVTHPLIHQSELNGYYDYAFHDYSVSDSLKPLPKRARKRYFIRATLPFFIFIPLFIIFPFTLFILIGWLLNLVLAYFRYKDAGYEVNEDQLTFRFRRIARTTMITKKQYIQSVNIRQSLFQQFFGLATIEIHVLSSPSSTAYSVKDVTIEEAIKIYQWVKPL